MPEPSPTRVGAVPIRTEAGIVFAGGRESRRPFFPVPDNHLISGEMLRSRTVDAAP